MPNKYDRKITTFGGSVTADVYDVLVAFSVTCPARAHAIKKLLCAGLRGKGSVERDLSEAITATERALQLAMVAPHGVIISEYSSKVEEEPDPF